MANVRTAVEARQEPAVATLAWRAAINMVTEENRKKTEEQLTSRTDIRVAG